MIRKIEKTDKAIFLLFSRAFYNSDAVLHSVSDTVLENNFNEMMNSPRFLEGFIFEYENTPCGYGIISKSYSPEVGGICIWIEEIYIEESYRGYQLGTKFLKMIEENYEYARLRLEVEQSNDKALQLYLRKGYQKLDYIQMHKEN